MNRYGVQYHRQNPPSWSSSALMPWAAPSPARMNPPTPGLLGPVPPELISIIKAIIATSTNGYRHPIAAALQPAAHFALGAAGLQSS